MQPPLPAAAPGQPRRGAAAPEGSLSPQDNGTERRPEPGTSLPTPGCTFSPRHLALSKSRSTAASHPPSSLPRIAPPPYSPTHSAAGNGCRAPPAPRALAAFLCDALATADRAAAAPRSRRRSLPAVTGVPPSGGGGPEPPSPLVPGAAAPAAPPRAAPLRRTGCSGSGRRWAGGAGPGTCVVLLQLGSRLNTSGPAYTESRALRWIYQFQFLSDVLSFSNIIRRGVVRLTLLVVHAIHARQL